MTAPTLQPAPRTVAPAPMAQAQNAAPPLYPPGTTAPPLQPVPPFDPSTPPPWTGPPGPPGPQGEQGEVGAQGPQGVQGEVGPVGPQGEQGVQGPPGGAPAWQGEWSASVDYANNDAVSLNGSSWYAAGDPALGTSPPSAPWQQIAAKGDTGPQGPQGVQGTTGPQGDTGPQGAQGATGATGSQGPAGATGAQGAQGPQGATGAQGPQGNPGVQGPAGPGVPTGGTAGQILVKTSSTDFATVWQNVIVTQAMWDALVARVTALEARPVIDAQEDLKYGN